MKPSERIEEIYNSIICPPENKEILAINRHLAICKYLDEEYEKKQKEELADLIQQDIQSNFKSKLL
jgi:hypothetical protein